MSKWPCVGFLAAILYWVVKREGRRIKECCEMIWEPKAPTCVSSGVPRFAFHIKCLLNLALANIASCRNAS